MKDDGLVDRRLKGRTENVGWLVTRSLDVAAVTTERYVYVIRVGTDPLEMQLARVEHPLSPAEIRALADAFVRRLALEA